MGRLAGSSEPGGLAGPLGLENPTEPRSVLITDDPVPATSTVADGFALSGRGSSEYPLVSP